MPAESVLSRLMIAFAGRQLPTEIAAAVGERGYAGVSLFRDANVDSVGQVRALTAQLQGAASPSSRPLLIATDQEGGQLNALGDGPTEFAGAMAIGATGDASLAERVAAAMAREMLAIGVNVDYAPVCDLAVNPDNPGIGIRSFGDDPVAVGEMAAATVRGLQTEGVAATAKHFPGIGGVGGDTHHGLVVLDRDRERLLAEDLLPFRAAIEAGARLVMAGHAAVPSVSGNPNEPASVSPRIIGELLRTELGFEGLVITDALDMRALAQGPLRVVEAIAALRAGEDLLLATPDPVQITELEQGLLLAARRGLLTAGDAATRRMAELRAWLRQFPQTELDIVGHADHLALAAELAQRSLTLVRNDAGLLPLRLPTGSKLAVIMSQPADMTPADTSSRVPSTLAAALRRRHATVTELTVSVEPSDVELAAVRNHAAQSDAVIVGSVAANIVRGQAALVEAALSAGRPTVTVALRTPWDLAEYPRADTHVCTYGALPPTMEALAGALFGETRFTGRLPVTLRDLYPRGHGIAA